MAETPVVRVQPEAVAVFVPVVDHALRGVVVVVVPVTVVVVGRGTGLEGVGIDADQVVVAVLIVRGVVLPRRGTQTPRVVRVAETIPVVVPVVDDAIVGAFLVRFSAALCNPLPLL